MRDRLHVCRPLRVPSLDLLRDFIHDFTRSLPSMNV